MCQIQNFYSSFLYIYATNHHKPFLFKFPFQKKCQGNRVEYVPRPKDEVDPKSAKGRASSSSRARSAKSSAKSNRSKSAKSSRAKSGKKSGKKKKKKWTARKKDFQRLVIADLAYRCRKRETNKAVFLKTTTIVVEQWRRLNNRKNV